MRPCATHQEHTESIHEPRRPRAQPLSRRQVMVVWYVTLPSLATADWLAVVRPELLEFSPRGTGVLFALKHRHRNFIVTSAK